jgi:hypothetical protein
MARNAGEWVGALRRWLPLLLWVCASLAQAQAAVQAAPEASAPAVLRERLAQARAQAARNPFQMPVYLQSTEAADRLQGEVFARVEQPFERARSALAGADRWCPILILHLNVKYCRAERAGTADVLQVAIGRKFDQPLADAYWVRFDFRVASAAADYLQLVLQAPSGPMGTRDYRIAVELAPAEDGRTVLHMTYAYAYGTTARWAMQAYLATIARDKVGFSVVGRRADGTPTYIGGVRGVVERNTMRYYLAIEAYLAAQALPAPEQLARSLEQWFDATEQYAQQLHEIDRPAYLEMKRHEVQRQATTPPPGAN